MASTIKVDNVQNQPGTNIVNKCSTTVNIGATSDNIRSAGNNLQAADGGNLISQCGTTITLGASGDTVSLASGASQSGFGRTGTVDWDTASIKTTTFTAVSGNGYFCNTTSGGFTADLPASPSAGDIVAFSDYAGTAGSNKLTIGRNGSNFEGTTSDGALSVDRQAVTLVYVDVTQGWVPVGESDSSFENKLYVTATSPCVTTSGDYKIHKFTGPGTFCVSCAGNASGSNTVDYLVVAGGGGGAGMGTYGYPRGAGGGGAGGMRLSSTTYTNAGPSAPRAPASGPTAVPGLAVPAAPYAIVVGGGGTSGPSGGPGNPGAGPGNVSTFSTITSAGGGGGSPHCGPSFPGVPGGSGSGGANTAGAGCGNDPPVTPPQGMPAGTGGGSNNNFAGGGGGGFMVAGTGGNPTGKGSCGGAGGGVPNDIAVCTGVPCGSYRYFSGGGAGGWGNAGPGVPGNCGGLGGGGNGGSGSGAAAGTCNTGGGGGANGGAPNGASGTTGGSGIVIIRYKFQN